MKISRFAELDTRAFATPTSKLLGLMVKIRDERSGCIHADGTISKPVTNEDRARLEKGVNISKEILVQAGAEENSFLISKPQGAHPGGTAAIGEVVNNKLGTEVENLFVCDASILPVAPGLPPILTIVALGKWLAKSLA
jgi:choline dehydrogenase-like flavoprotein